MKFILNDIKIFGSTLCYYDFENILFYFIKKKFIFFLRMINTTFNQLHL
jgi:hypothetical protein